jgi:hypothetical protein
VQLLISITISVIWKQNCPPASLAPPGTFPIMAVYRKWESVENRWLSTGWMEEEERQLACAIRDLHLSAQFLLIMVTVLTRLDQERARSSHVVEQGKG